MQARKLRVGFAFFNYGSNGGIASEHPDIRRWAIPTVIAAKCDSRIEDIVHEDFCDTPITMSRNAAVEWAKSAAVDVLVMIDSDQAPDKYLGADPEAKPFFMSSFDFLYERFDKQLSVIVAPYCGPPSDPVKGGLENVYVFRWTNFNTGHNEWPVKLEAYGRMEAALMTGIANCDTGPTGLCMIDMRIFEHLSYPYFDYEWMDDGKQCQSCHQHVPGPRAKKASTEDCFFFRNIALNCCVRLGYNPVFCNWDAWAGHWKPWCVGKPVIVTSDAVGRQLHEAVKHAPPSGVKLKRVENGQSNGKSHANGEGVIPSAPEHTQTLNALNDLQFAMRERCGIPDDTPGPDDLGHKTPADDLAALEKIIEGYVRARDWGDRKLCIVELGSWVGKSARTIVGAIPHGIDYEIHCVDTFAAPAKGSQWATNLMDDACARRIAEGDDDPVFNQFTKNVGHLLGNRIFYHRITTLDMAKIWRPLIDILFVDADHSYMAVRSDLTAWVPHVRPDGLIVGDDYRTMPEVKDAVDRFFSPLRVAQVCNMWFTVKDSVKEPEDGERNECGQNSEAAISG